MKDVYTVLRDRNLRDCPAMYLGVASITRLCMFLYGYGACIFDCTGSMKFYAPMRQFTWHLTHKYHVLMSYDWSSILLHLRADDNEEEAFSLFWEEWDEFISKPCTCPQNHVTDDNGQYIWCYCGKEMRLPPESLMPSIPHSPPVEGNDGILLSGESHVSTKYRHKLLICNDL